MLASAAGQHGGHGRRGAGVDARQPEVEREQPQLDPEGHEEEHRDDDRGVRVDRRRARAATASISSVPVARYSAATAIRKSTEPSRLTTAKISAEPSVAALPAEPRSARRREIIASSKNT